VEGMVIRPEWRPITQTSTKPPLLFILQFIHSFSLTHTNNPSIESSILLPLLSHLLPYSPLRTNNANGDSFNFPLFIIHIYIYSLDLHQTLILLKFKFIKIHFGGFAFPCRQTSLWDYSQILSINLLSNSCL
jgi:hypothetical protein